MAPELVARKDMGVTTDSNQDQYSQQQQTSMAGDVWAFGVVIWEMFAAGCPIPLADKSDLHVLSALEVMATSVSSPLRASRRAAGGEQQWLRRPTSCPDLLWSMATRCMDPSPARRPTFFDVVGELDELKVKDDSIV
jgi:serine/threonine protein kinase